MHPKNKKVAILQLFPYHKLMNEKLKDALVLVLEVAGLLVVFIALLLFLNFFNVLSLSTIYPNQFGFLPHLNQTITSSTVENQPTGAVPSNQSSLANFVKLQNQASNKQIAIYQAYAARFSKPTAQTNPNDYVSDAIFAGYDNKTIQVVTKDGVLNLGFDTSTLFQKQPNPSTQTNSATNSGLLPKALPYVSSADFFKYVVFGSILQVTYSKPDLKVTQVNFIESIKPVL